MTLFQILIAPLCAFLALRTLVRTRYRQGPKRQGLLWTALWTLAAVLIAAPGSTQWIAAQFGIGRGSDLVFYLAILAGLATASHLYNRCRQMEVVLTALVRQEAIDRAEQPADGG